MSSCLCLASVRGEPELVPVLGLSGVVCVVSFLATKERFTWARAWTKSQMAHVRDRAGEMVNGMGWCIIGSQLVKRNKAESWC